MPCPTCQGSETYGHEPWCGIGPGHEITVPLSDTPQPEQPNYAHIIRIMDRFRTDGLPALPERPTFASVDECNTWWQARVNTFDDTVRRVADVALKSVPEAALKHP
jgi:hypothetical protein